MSLRLHSFRERLTPGHSRVRVLKLIQVSSNGRLPAYPQFQPLTLESDFPHGAAGVSIHAACLTKTPFNFHWPSCSCMDDACLVISKNGDVRDIEALFDV